MYGHLLLGHFSSVALNCLWDGRAHGERVLEPDAVVLHESLILDDPGLARCGEALGIEHLSAKGAVSLSRKPI